MALHCRIERNTLRTENEFVQILPVASLNLDAGAYVFCDKGIVENDQITDRSVPSTILERVLRSIQGLKHDVRHISGTDPMAVCDELWIAAAK
jgi:hypothetical protein